MEIEGTIVEVLGRQEGVSKAGKPWKKDEYVLETPGTYPRRVKFTIFGDRCDTMRCEPGKTYSFSFDLESREFNGRWYTDVNVYAIRDINSAAPAAAATSAPTSAGVPPQSTYATPSFEAPAGDSSDDLPF